MRIVNKLWYLCLFIIPMLIYPFTINGQVVEMRKVRELALFSFAIVICGFLQRSVWLRLLLIWIVINWWLNLFINVSYMPMVNILCAMIIYIGIKELLRSRILSINGIIKVIICTALFQSIWAVMQIFNFDPVFYLKKICW